MNNPLFGNQQMPMNNMQNLVQQFQQFRNMFRGNPQQQVQQLLNSGKISQQQYNSAYQTAQQLQKILSQK